MRTVVALSGVFLLASCSLFQRSAPMERPIAAPQPAQQNALAPNAESPRAEARRIGDVVIHRVSGTFRKNPLLLTEKTIGKDGQHWVVDLTLEDGGSVSRLRVRMDDEGQVAAVSELDGEREIPATVDYYQALIDKTMLVADENEGLLGSQNATCLLGARELDCETKTYKVRVGNQSAMMKVSATRELGGREIDGEITTKDGLVLYRSELVAVERAAETNSTASR